MNDVVFVTVDSLRADHVGWHGYERNTTPHLDQIAEEASVYENTFAHACSTRASFPSIMTSTYALMHGGYERLSDKRESIAEVLQDAGYETAGFHSNLYLAREFGYARGFQDFFDSKTSSGLLARARQSVKIHIDNESRVYQFLQWLFDSTEERAGVELGSAYVNAADITDKAIQWVESESEKPRFLWVHYMDVHHPYTPPREHQLRFRNDIIDSREAVKLRRKMLERPAELSDHELSNIVDLYDAEISFVDTEIARLHGSIMSHWGEDTVFAFTADHGEEFGDHGGFSHSHTFYDELLHVPTFVNDGSGQSRHKGLAGLLDMPPTLIEAAGAEPGGSFLGTPLQYVETERYDRSSVIAEGSEGETREHRFGIRTTDWKYIVDAEGSERLYDLNEDPAEREDRSQHEHATIGRFRERLEEHRALLGQNQEDLGEVSMDENVKQRLRDLGYRE